MDTLDDSEKNAKVSDSAYSNSCSNSQSRRSHSSKSTHSGSNSSGSSGYGGKPSTSGCSYNLSQSQKREKEIKKKKSQSEIITDVPTETENRPPETTSEYNAPMQDENDVIKVHSPTTTLAEKDPESMDVSDADRNSCKDEVVSCNTPIASVSVDFVTSRPSSTFCSDGFSCVISMEDGVVMYTTSSLTSTLGFPKDMWIGRSFIDFIHPRDRNTFASQITSNLAVPKIVNGAQEKAQLQGNSDSSMICRIRRYRCLTSGFGVKDRVVTFMPFLLKLTFKNINDEEGKGIYLIILATPFFSAFKIPNEIMTTAVPFVIRHAANGYLEYIDPESVPYLGYLPQDIADKDALQMYHPEDLNYLLQVYETIVKEGGVARSKPYRMMTQNGGFVRVEIEWSSFINPWSRKLEFVIGKHHITEGPSNPDVFQSPDPDKVLKLSEEEKNKAKMIRECIVRVMNDVLTKPAGIAKQQMSKRCRDLASFIESLMEEQTQPDDEFRLEIQDADHSCYERDSVMLGGISPHHDYNDSKSSTETPLSYNQLNYNETLHRYFDSNLPNSYEEYNMVTSENVLGLNDSKPSTSKCVSPLEQISGDSGVMTSTCESGSLAVRGNSPVTTLTEYQHLRLTESLLNKRNTEMEKELMKLHRETRSGSKGTREKVYNENRKKKKEHLARCNASFHHTALSTQMSVVESQVPVKCHGVKRTLAHDTDPRAQKHHCSNPRTSKRKNMTSAAPAQSSSTVTTVIANNNWPSNPVNNMGTFLLGVGIPQQMSMMSPMPTAMPGVYPVYYPPSSTPRPSEPAANVNTPVTMLSGTNPQFSANPMQCMMYGQPVYGSPFMYSPMHQMPYSMQQRVLNQQSIQCNTLNPLGLATDTYEETCKSSLTLRSSNSSVWHDKKRTNSQEIRSKHEQESVNSSSSNNALNRSNATVPESSTLSRNSKKTDRLGNSEEAVDRTDGESSYSSFYSSFFRTESGSAEESGEAKKKDKFNKVRFWDKTLGPDEASAAYQGNDAYYEPQKNKKAARRKMEPPWMEQVCVTSELVYKYQILTKSMDEVLIADKIKIMEYEQPSLVNEQLGQLYVDLQLEGVAARLTLEEGITSSSSSSEESSKTSSKGYRKKRNYNKLVMIYEEDAPLPPPTDGESLAPSASLPKY